MLRRGLTLFALLALAAPAHATTFKGRADAGPSIAGDSVVWGQEYSDGSGAVKRDGKVIAHFSDPAGKRRHRLFGQVPGGVSASPTRVAYALVTSTEDPPNGQGDVGGSSSEVTARLSVGGGAFTDPLGCTGSYISTAAEGDSVALGVSGGCEGVYLNGRKISDTPSAEVHLAGPYVAWLAQAKDGITIADAATGTAVSTIKGEFGRFDLDAAGNVITAQGDAIVAFTVSDDNPRVLCTRAWASSVATAGGRVAYITANKTSGPKALVVADLATGKVLRTLERFNDHRWPNGELALTDHRIAWSVRHGGYEENKARGIVRTVRL